MFLRIAKIILIIETAFGAESSYRRPKWKTLIKLMNAPEGLMSRSFGLSWGRPAEGSLRPHSECPSLELPEGADSFFCNGSTCVVKCLPGFHPGVGNPRTHCRYNGRAGRAAWNRKPPACVSCQEPTFTDKYIEAFCYTNTDLDIPQKMCDLSCSNNGLLRNPEVKGSTIRCKCEKNSANCYWTKRRQKKAIVTEAMECKRNTSRAGVSHDMTHCSQKKAECLNVLNLPGSSASIVPSTACPGCSRLVVILKPPATFDNQDWINIDFTAPVSRFVSWSFPVSGVEKQPGESQRFQRWRVEFDPRVKFNNGAIKLSAEIELEAGRTGIQYVEICPCSIGYVDY